MLPECNWKCTGVGRSLGFAKKTSLSFLIVGKVLGPELEYYGAFESGVLRLEDDTHPALAELLDDAVVADGGAGCPRQGNCSAMRSLKGLSLWALSYFLYWDFEEMTQFGGLQRVKTGRCEGRKALRSLYRREARCRAYEGSQSRRDSL